MSGWLWSDAATIKAKEEARAKRKEEAHAKALVALRAMMQSEEGVRAAQQLVQGGELKCPEDAISDLYLRKWLVAREWDVPLTYSCIVNHARWRAHTMPNGYIDEAWIQQPLADEKTYLQGCDNKGRAFAIIQVAKHIAHHSSMHAMKLFTCYTMDAMSALCDTDTNPGRRLVSMFDLTACGFANLDVASLRIILRLLSEHYVEQLDAMWFYNPPLIAWGLWNTLKPLLPEVTRNKIKFIDPGDCHELREAVHDDVSELRSDDATIRSKAVVAARELLVAPQKHIQCIAAGITPALVGLLAVPDESLQADAAITLQLLMSKEVGCRDTLQHCGLTRLLQLLIQPSATVKDAVYDALGAAQRFESFRTALMNEQGALAALVMHAQQEEPSRAARALGLLWHCTQVRHNQDALSALIHVVHAVPKLAAIISSDKPEPVRLGATKLLAALASTQQDGRTQAVDAGCVPVLLELVATSPAQLACAAAGALMMVSLAKEGKVEMQQARGVSALFNVLATQQQQQMQQVQPGSTEEEMVANVLQTLTNVAEHPACRAELQELGASSLLQGIQEGPSSAGIRKAAGQALRMVGFRSWPQ